MHGLARAVCIVDVDLLDSVGPAFGFEIFAWPCAYSKAGVDVEQHKREKRKCTYCASSRERDQSAYGQCEPTTIHACYICLRLCWPLDVGRFVRFYEGIVSLCRLNWEGPPQYKEVDGDQC